MSENSQETSAYAGYSSLAFDRPAKGVLRITLNRPERLNALDARGHDELAACGATSTRIRASPP
jgi:enoyl-CoA hydratase